MKRILALLVCSLAFTALPAAAEEVTCESNGGARVECPMDTRGEVRIVRQLSKTRCVDGQNWGLSRHSVWVSGGCRAVFSSAGSGDDGGRGYDGGGRGYDGGSSYGGAPASGAAPDRVTCESQDGRRTECEMNTRGRVRVERQLSKTQCIEDRNWGLSKHSIWVDGGCRAVFALEGAGEAPGSASAIERQDAQYQGDDRAPQAALRGCNTFADQGYDGKVLSTNALKPGYWEIILRFEEYRYVCNVDSRGQVSSFEKLD